MTYESTELSVQGSHVAELYTFEGTLGAFRYTSYACDYEFEGEIFRRLPGLTRKSMDLATVAGSSSGELEVALPFTTDVARRYAFSDVPPTLNFKLQRVHVDTDNSKTLWTGAGGVWTVKGRTATLKIPSSFATAMETTFPARRWQGPCNHLLYDGRCGVSRAANSQDTTITAIRNTQIEVAGYGLGDNECVGGEIINNDTGERRTIRSHKDLAFRVKLPFAVAEVGQSITICRGCNHSAAQCKARFDNIDRFGGMNLVPSLNPFGSTLR
jgi:hypothetical protein